MKKFFNFAVLAIALFALTPAKPAHAVKRYFEDAKFPNQMMVEKQTFTDLLAANTTYILSANAGPTSAAAATVTTFAHQPDSPRNLTITPAGTTGDVEACVVTVTGTNIFDRTISENFTFAADASTAQTGNFAFKTVTSVAWAANCESGGFAATWNVGIGEKIGLKRCLDSPGHIFFSTLDSGSGFSKEATAPTMRVNAASIHDNTADFNGTMNGTNDFELFFIQNFRCLP